MERIDYMKIDKETVDRLTKMPDDRLWLVVSALAASAGLNLTGVKVGAAEMQKLRRVLGEVNDSDITRAMEILDASNIRYGGNDGNRK